QIAARCGGSELRKARRRYTRRVRVGRQRLNGAQVVIMSREGAGAKALAQEAGRESRGGANLFLLAAAIATLAAVALMLSPAAVEPPVLARGNANQILQTTGIPLGEQRNRTEFEVGVGGVDQVGDSH